MVNRVLLLGAGFSRNWGGPLASEMFGTLLQQPEIQNDQHLKDAIWRHKDGGGFENALSDIQQDYLRNPSSPEFMRRMEAFQQSINRIFQDMDNSFSEQLTWEFTNERKYMLLGTLVKFDAIFTLNQDLLFERFYFNDNVMLESQQRWNRVIIPGVQELHRTTFQCDPGKSYWSPTEKDGFNVDERSQPYFKLHGSWRWVDGAGKQLMIMGGNKSTLISAYPILSWYQEEFRRRLSGNTRILVIGYGFNDPHINNTILEVAESGGLKMFIVDPLGESVANPDRNLSLKRENPFKNVITGTSSRLLREIFGSDTFTHNNVSRFLND